MAELHIRELICLNQEDSNANDEVTLHVDGIPLFGPHKMADGEVVDFKVDYTFTGTVAVTLIEQDGAGVDDFLGTVAIPDTLAGLGDETGLFHAALPHAHYHMRYHVHP